MCFGCSESELSHFIVHFLLKVQQSAGARGLSKEGIVQVYFHILTKEQLQRPGFHEAMGQAKHRKLSREAKSLVRRCGESWPVLIYGTSSMWV